jgi:hypothetical protein
MLTIESGLQKAVSRGLLKWAAGRAMFCPHCDTVADYRRYVLVHRGDNSLAWEGCAACYDRLGLDPVPDTWEVIREAASKPRKPPALPLTSTIRDKNGKPQDIACCRAFDMYGHTFVAHPSLVNPAMWVITHTGTGAAACVPQKSKAAAIRIGMANLDRVGLDGFTTALAYAMQSISKGK